jgi:hypothetical protein
MAQSPWQLSWRSEVYNGFNRWKPIRLILTMRPPWMVETEFPQASLMQFWRRRRDVSEVFNDRGLQEYYLRLSVFLSQAIISVL